MKILGTFSLAWTWSQWKSHTSCKQCRKCTEGETKGNSVWQETDYMHTKDWSKWLQHGPILPPRMDPSWNQNGSKIDPKMVLVARSSPKPILDGFWIDLGSILDWFWIDFGLILERFWDRSWLISGAGVVSKLRWFLIYVWMDLRWAKGMMIIIVALYVSWFNVVILVQCRRIKTHIPCIIILDVIESSWK